MEVLPKSESKLNTNSEDIVFEVGPLMLLIHFHELVISNQLYMFIKIIDISRA